MWRARDYHPGLQLRVGWFADRLKGDAGMAQNRRGLLSLVVVAAGALLLSACGTASAANVATTKASARPAGRVAANIVRGGVVTFAEAPGSAPDSIFPVYTGSTLTTYNVSDFVPLLYKSLWVSNFDEPTVNYADSIATRPVWSDGDRVVTFSLKHYVWSNGQPVTTRDVTFFVNLVRAAGANWGNYETGDFPYNVKSMKIESPTKMSFTLDGPYNPTYYLGNWLTDIIPLPQAVWDRESLHGKVGNYDETPAGAKKVYNFLEAYSLKTSTYSDTNPIWGVTDGPYKLTSFGGDASPDVFVPNPTYSGHRSIISKFEEIPYTSNAAEYNDLRSGNSALTIGFVPFSDVPTIRTVKSAGYNIDTVGDWGMDYALPNLKNPALGPALSQLYLRQAIQHLVDQPLMVKYFLHGYGVPTYGPVPVYPKKNPYLDAYELHNPYPYNVAAAKTLLQAHGWRAVKGVQTCESATACGKGVKKGTKLVMKMLYSNGSTSTTQEMELFASDAEKAGIKIILSEEPFNTVVGILNPCTPGQDGVTDSSPVCTWQLGSWGGWGYGLFPSGGELFYTGAADNSGSYSDAEVNKLIVEIRHSSTLAPFYRYENLVSEQVPAIWMPTGDSIDAVASNIRGPGLTTAFGNLDPNEWYFVKK
jgi:peptide/nickel transport system substrate-binding protein